MATIEPTAYLRLLYMMSEYPAEMIVQEIEKELAK